MTYNGYENYEVWNVALWSDNDPDLYQRKFKLYEDYADGKLTEKQLKAKLHAVIRSSAAKSDIKGGKLGGRNHAAVLRHFVDEAKEHKEYKERQGR